MKNLETRGVRNLATNSSHSSSISTESIKHIVEKLKRNRIRSSTQHNYYGIWKHFNEFFVKLDIKPDNWEDRLVLFIGYLIDKKCKSSTIRSYISAIKSVLHEDGVILNKDRFLLNSLTNACKLVNDHVRTRLPIQIGMLRILVEKVEDIFDSQPFLATLYSALFTTAYFGLFRVGELTKGDHPVKVIDVHLAENKRKILMILRTSKTHWKDTHPQTIKIVCHKNAQVAKNNNLCPFKILNRYIDCRLEYDSPLEQFFVFADGSPVLAFHFRKTLKTVLKAADFDSSLYDTHSMRSGRVVDLLKLHVSIEDICKLGRWKSSAVYSYLKI